MIRFILIVLSLMMTTPSYASKAEFGQICSGFLIQDKHGVSLILTHDVDLDDKKQSLWCPAGITREFLDNKSWNIITNACRLGSPCLIVGKAQGRGVFYWTKIIFAMQQEETSDLNLLISDDHSRTLFGKCGAPKDICEEVIGDMIDYIISSSREKQ